MNYFKGHFEQREDCPSICIFCAPRNPYLLRQMVDPFGLTATNLFLDSITRGILLICVLSEISSFLIRQLADKE